MFGSAFIEVIIGITFLYMLLSLVCSALGEIISQVFKLRAKTLEKGLQRILSDENIRHKFYNHPLIRSLGKKSYNSNLVRPSYIPPQTFAMVLLNIVSDQDKSGAKSSENKNKLDGLKKQISGSEEDVKKAIFTLIEAANGDFNQAMKNVESWFNNVMDRASGWYKRRTQIILLGLALIVSVAMNVDTICITSTLWQDSALRQYVANVGTKYAEENNPQNTSTQYNKEMSQNLAKIHSLGLPIGWQDKLVPKNSWEWFTKCIGWLCTTIAVSLGAPFWFDLLNKFVRLRGAGRIPEKSTEDEKAKKKESLTAT